MVYPLFPVFFDAARIRLPVPAGKERRIPCKIDFYPRSQAESLPEHTDRPEAYIYNLAFPEAGVCPQGYPEGNIRLMLFRLVQKQLQISIDKDPVFSVRSLRCLQMKGCRTGHHHLPVFLLILKDYGAPQFISRVAEGQRFTAVFPVQD